MFTLSHSDIFHPLAEYPDPRLSPTHTIQKTINIKKAKKKKIGKCPLAKLQVGKNAMFLKTYLPTEWYLR